MTQSLRFITRSARLPVLYRTIPRRTIPAAPRLYRTISRRATPAAPRPYRTGEYGAAL